jgi:hypothetical protein
MTKLCKKEFLNKKFNKLTVIEDDYTQKYVYHKEVKCLCECGATCIKKLKYILSGETKSCGCLKLLPAHVTHGMTNTPEHKVWFGIKRRCYNQNEKNYKDYGAKGIVMSDDWKNNFLSFYNDMGPRPDNSFSIERKNNQGNYEKDNCKWATSKEQGRNKSNNFCITYKGETKCASEWEEILGLNKSSGILQKRLKRGWSIEKTMETPSLGRSFS